MTDVAVGLPKPGTGTATHGYTDTQINTRDARYNVTDVREQREAGVDVGTKVRVS